MGNNGAGKTTFLAAIARLLPAVRGEKRIFLDADFCINRDGSCGDIVLAYDVSVDFSDGSGCSSTITIVGKRKNTGRMRGHLNDQVPAGISVTWSELEARDRVTSVIEQLSQRVIRNGWGGGRIVPINLDKPPGVNHAAIVEGEERGGLDGLRARLTEVKKNSEIAAQVEARHPNLLNNTLNFANSFLGTRTFDDVFLSHAEQLSIERSSGLSHSWSEMSGGESSVLNLAMAIESESVSKSSILLVEEPETGLHPTIQRQYVRKLVESAPGRQLFISTHSPYIFEEHIDDSTLLLFNREANLIHVTNGGQINSLFTRFSSGELSYYAYGLPTFEFHNELYGHIQERQGKHTTAGFDQYVRTKGTHKGKKWIRATRNGTISENVTLMTYIRNFTHHPENTNNVPYTAAELDESIKAMLSILSQESIS